MQKPAPKDRRGAEVSRKLEALKEAVRIGIEDLECGEFEEFESVEDLRAYLKDLSEKVISEQRNRNRDAAP
jgi:antitoxin ParD1/3/4